MGCWHSGKINILWQNFCHTVNHHLSWLELSPQMPTPAILLQDKNFLLSSVHCDNPAVLVDTKWSNCLYTSIDAMKKVSEKAGKIPLIGNNPRKDLLQSGRTKRVHLSVPYHSHLVREDIRWKKSLTFGHCPKGVGGVYRCPNFLALFLPSKSP